LGRRLLKLDYVLEHFIKVIIIFVKYNVKAGILALFSNKWVCVNVAFAALAVFVTLVWSSKQPK
jgi:hypothetical protein